MVLTMIMHNNIKNNFNFIYNKIFHCKKNYLTGVAIITKK